MPDIIIIITTNNIRDIINATTDARMMTGQVVTIEKVRLRNWSLYFHPLKISPLQEVIPGEEATVVIVIKKRILRSVRGEEPIIAMKEEAVDIDITAVRIAMTVNKKATEAKGNVVQYR